MNPENPYFLHLIFFPLLRKIEFPEEKGRMDEWTNGRFDIFKNAGNIFNIIYNIYIIYNIIIIIVYSIIALIFPPSSP